MPTQRLPPARNVGEAIEASASLAGLLAGHRRATQLFQRILPSVPGPLRSQLRPGPIEGVCWTLLTENSASAAKLRQLLPDLLASTAQHDSAITELKLKIRPRDSAS
ncbi:MAG: hypothetical protein JNJ71_04325 [Rubrivivax sp.]|nr:hypothetical protein [Rubrivivax sp.]